MSYPKQSIMKRTAILFFTVLFFQSSFLFAQDPQPKENLEIGKLYVVIGVYSFEKNAIRFNEVATETLGNSAIGYHPVRKWHYVYTGPIFDSFSDAKTLFEEVRVNPGFDSTWIYKVEPYEMPEAQKTEVIVAKDETVERKEDSQGVAAAEENAENKGTEIAGATATGIATTEMTSDTDINVGKVSKDDKGNEIEVGQKFYFNTFKSKNFREVEGQVEIVDPTRVKTLGIRETHELVYVNIENATGEMQVLCDIFGYKKMQHDFNLKDSINERTRGFLEIKGDTMVVDFELKRYTKGDLVSMFNIFFFNNSAIMKDESKYQLGQLMDMLEDNDKYQIGIYGNTNGSAAGEIISLPEDSNEFFNLKAGSDGFGSAKKLSKERAEIIKRFLVDQGIDESRIKVKGNGGKKPLYDKFDTRAYRNLRVDVEILADQ